MAFGVFLFIVLLIFTGEGAYLYFHLKRRWAPFVLLLMYALAVAGYLLGKSARYWE